MDVPAQAATCFDCGYDLRGLPPEGRCPECGLSAAESAGRREMVRAAGAVVPVCRATFRLLVVAATGILAALLIGGLEYAVDRWRWRYGWTSRVIAASALTWTLLTAFLIASATSILLARSPPTDRFGRGVRRLLGTLGWTIPSLLVGFWLLAWVDPPRYGRRVSLFYALQEVLPMSLTIAGALFLPSFTTEVARRVRLWPRPLPGSWLSIVTSAMWISLLVQVPGTLFNLWQVLKGHSGWHRRLFTPLPINPARDVLSLATLYLAATAAALLMLTVIFFKARRLARSLAASTAGGTDKERQPAAAGAGGRLKSARRGRLRPPLFATAQRR